MKRDLLRALRENLKTAEVQGPIPWEIGYHHHNNSCVGLKQAPEPELVTVMRAAMVCTDLQTVTWEDGMRSTMGTTILHPVASKTTAGIAAMTAGTPTTIAAETTTAETDQVVMEATPVAAADLEAGMDLVEEKDLGAESDSTAGNVMGEASATTDMVKEATEVPMATTAIMTATTKLAINTLILTTGQEGTTAMVPTILTIDVGATASTTLTSPTTQEMTPTADVATTATTTTAATTAAVTALITDAATTAPTTMT